MRPKRQQAIININVELRHFHLKKLNTHLYLICFYLLSGLRRVAGFFAHRLHCFLFCPGQSCSSIKPFGSNWPQSHERVDVVYNSAIYCQWTFSRISNKCEQHISWNLNIIMLCSFLFVTCQKFLANMFVCPFVCLYVRLSVCLSVSLSVLSSITHEFRAIGPMEWLRPGLCTYMALQFGEINAMITFHHIYLTNDKFRHPFN